MVIIIRNKKTIKNEKKQNKNINIIYNNNIVRLQCAILKPKQQSIREVLWTTSFPARMPTAESLQTLRCEP